MHVFVDIEYRNALAEFAGLLALSMEMFSKYFGSRGVNSFMRELESLLILFWDWKILPYRGATRECVVAVQRAYTMMLPRLRNTLWPTCFPYVEHHWPNSKDLAIQYVMLVRRVRSKMATLGGRALFEVPKGAMVELVRGPCRIIEHSLSPFFRKKQPRGGLRILVLIDTFLLGKREESAGLRRKWRVAATINMVVIFVTAP